MSTKIDPKEALVNMAIEKVEGKPISDEQNLDDPKEGEGLLTARRLIDIVADWINGQVTNGKYSSITGLSLGEKLTPREAEVMLMTADAVLIQLAKALVDSAREVDKSSLDVIQ